MSTMKPGCVVYNPSENSWCVLVESRKKNGEIRRFMSFHKYREVAEFIKKAHEDANADEPDVTVSIFEYEYVPNDDALAVRMMRETIERLVEELDEAEKEATTNDCND